MRACGARCVGVLLILLGVTTVFEVTADDSIGFGGDRSAAAQLGFQILIPQELSAVFQAGSDSTPVVSSSGGQVTFTVDTFRSSENRGRFKFRNPSQYRDRRRSLKQIRLIWGNDARFQ